METYRIDYLCNGHWTPGSLVRMATDHLRRYLQFLAGERPLVTFIEIDGRPTFKKIVERDPKRCLPTRLRREEPDWIEEDGYYLFDGLAVEFIDLSELDGQRVRLPRNPRA